jgi:methylenetetrahydrofolate dehydrogenase (NADP+)/methenyltetrahydrofolate cyclohydrolase
MDLDFKAIAAEIVSELSEGFRDISTTMNRPPVLCAVAVEPPADTLTYMRSKKRIAKNIGVEFREIIVAKQDSPQLGTIISDLAKDTGVDGIIIESPLPPGFSMREFAELIPPKKDVEGVTSVNQGLIAVNNELMLPATAYAITVTVERLGVPKGSHIVVINRSTIIGRPLAMMLTNRDYTVTICNSKTLNLKEIARSGDVIVTGVGKAGFLNADFVKPDSIVIDAAFNFANGELTGDSDYNGLKNIVRYISPVPGGIGQLTPVLIFRNLLKSLQLVHVNPA